MAGPCLSFKDAERTCTCNAGFKKNSVLTMNKMYSLNPQISNVQWDFREVKVMSFFYPILLYDTVG